jgi:Fe-S-cluster-containing hydrogenase component 2
MRVCPEEALYHDPVTQVVLLDQDRCHNCGL